MGQLLDRKRAEPEDEDARLPHNIVVVGFGPAGREALRGLDAATTRICVIELNSASLKDAMAAGYHCVLGDATQEEILSHAGARTARVVAITTPSPSVCLTVLDLDRTMAPQAKLVLRARHARIVPALENAGASAVACDEFEVGSRLREMVAGALAGEGATRSPPG